MDFASQKLGRPTAVTLGTLVHTDQALQGTCICLNKVISADSIKPSGRALLFPVDFGTQERHIDRKVRNRDRTEHTAGKSNNCIPVGEGHLVMPTPSLLPLLMEGLEDGSEVTNLLPLHCFVTGLNVVNI
jgi:hypothetical protein